MTVIAWDGETLAADKRHTNNGMIFSGTKIFHVGNLLVGCSGRTCVGSEMIEWIRKGRKPSKFPEIQKTEDFATTIVIEDRKATRYERTPYPCVIEDPFHAIGSGAEYALTAMYLGKSAKEAVEIASKFDDGCGNGVDVLYPPGRKSKKG